MVLAPSIYISICTSAAAIRRRVLQSMLASSGWVSTGGYTWLQIPNLARGGSGSLLQVAGSASSVLDSAVLLGLKCSVLGQRSGLSVAHVRHADSTVSVTIIVGPKLIIRHCYVIAGGLFCSVDTCSTRRSCSVDQWHLAVTLDSIRAGGTGSGCMCWFVVQCYKLQGQCSLDCLRCLLPRLLTPMHFRQLE